MSSFIHYVNYTAIGATNTFHNSPRFGHSNDFANLFSEQQAEQTDYIKGIIFAGVLIFSFFLVWLILLFVFKCLGTSVGFLSGARMIDPDTRNGSGGGCTTRPNIVRFFFCLSTVIVIVFTVLLVTKGLTDLKNTTTSLDDSNIKVADILEQFQGIATDLRSVGSTANETRAEILATLNNFCPNDPNLAQQTGLNLQSAGAQAASLLQELGDFIGSQIGYAQRQLTEAQHTSNDLHKALNKFNFHALALAFIVIYIVLPTLMLLGVLLAWFGFSNPCIQCMLSWLILPMWLLMVIVGVICTALSSWMVVANSDFCSGGTIDSPDATLKQILADRNVTTAEFLGEVTYFYITQCQAPDPWSFIQTYQANLTSANETVATLSSELNQAGLSTLQSICGTDFAPFENLLFAMELTLTTLIKDSVLALQLLSCDNIVPIYTSTMYNTACDYSVSALAWSFSAFLVISFFGMIMITLRSSWHDVMYINDYEAKLEPLGYPESAAPDDEDLPAPLWNSYEKRAPVEDYGNGNRYENEHNEYQEHSREEYPDHDLSSYQEDGEHHVEYYDDPQVVQEYDDKPSNGMYRSRAY